MSEETFTTEIGDGGGSVMPASVTEDSDSPQKILDELRGELEKTVERDIIEVEIPERPNVALRFNPNVPQSQMKQWRNNAGVNTKKGLDSIKFSCYVVGDTCVGIYINGKEVTDENDVSLTFASETIWEMSNASDAFEAIKDMFGIEPHIEATALAIIEAAGYGDEVETEDPFSRG